MRITLKLMAIVALACVVQLMASQWTQYHRLQEINNKPPLEDLNEAWVEKQKIDEIKGWN